MLKERWDERGGGRRGERGGGGRDGRRDGDEKMSWRRREMKRRKKR